MVNLLKLFRKNFGFLFSRHGAVTYMFNSVIANV